MTNLFSAILLFVFATSSANSCDGDCFSCHPKLLEKLDNEHQPMLLCKECHTKNIGSAECGADCFQCHKVESISRNIPEHIHIDKCRECHLGRLLKENLNFSPFNSKGADLRKLLGDK